MTVEIVNLRLARKRRAREDNERLAAERRARFGQTKAEKSAAKAGKEAQARMLDAHRLNAPDK